MRVEYDRRADAIYIRLREAEVASTRELQDNLIVDVDADGRTVGIELLFVSDYLRPEDLDTFTVASLSPSP
jgi:uncharacterized protein YuzE